jgi:hypothetical protein
MITAMRIAYKVGFSSAISPKAMSAYADAAKWTCVIGNDQKLFESFSRGWTDGYKLSTTVMKENSCKRNI